jgi:hypothetical protein
MYIFSKPQHKEVLNYAIPEDLQLCCRHELHILLPPDTTNKNHHDNNGETDDTTTTCSNIMDNKDYMQQFLQGVVPEGIRVEIPDRLVILLEPEEEELDDDDSNNLSKQTRVAIFLVVYCGEGKPLTRHQGNEYRAMAEANVAKHLSLRHDRVGRMVSRPGPSPLLFREIKYGAS